MSTPEHTLGTWATDLEVAAHGLAGVATSTSVPTTPAPPHTTTAAPGPWAGFAAVLLLLFVAMLRLRYGDHVRRRPANVR